MVALTIARGICGAAFRRNGNSELLGRVVRYTGGFMIGNRSTWPQIASAFAIGVSAGAALGLLFAPQSGEGTRRLLRNTVQDGVDEAVSRGKSAVRRGRESLDDAKQFVNEVADNAASAYHEARDAAS
jgi:hypothetical protein